MKYSLYFFEGQQKTFVEEKFDVPISIDIQTYVWKSADGSLGFNSDENSMKFVGHLLQDKVSILLPSMRLIETEDEVQKNIQNLVGVSFFDNLELIKREYHNYLDYDNKKKTNELLIRYGKTSMDLEVPILLKSYNKAQMKYTKDFSNFCIDNNLKFIIWRFSDYGIYFYTFNKIEVQVIP